MNDNSFARDGRTDEALSRIHGRLTRAVQRLEEAVEATLAERSASVDGSGDAGALMPLDPREQERIAERIDSAIGRIRTVLGE